MAGNEKYLFVKVVVPYSSSGVLFAVVPHDHVGKLDSGETVSFILVLLWIFLKIIFLDDKYSCFVSPAQVYFWDEDDFIHFGTYQDATMGIEQGKIFRCQVLDSSFQRKEMMKLLNEAVFSPK